MKRRLGRVILSTITIGAIALSLSIGPATAATKAGPQSAGPAQSHGHGEPLVDRNGNGVSDGLDARLQHAAAAERIDVVATFGDRADMRSARASVGGAHTSFSLIPGFATRLTAGQIRALSHRPGVLRVEPNFEIHALDDAANRDFGVTKAQTNLGATGAGTEVCVVDTGVDVGHEQLNSKTPIGWDDEVNHLGSPYDDNGHGTSVASIAVGDGTGGSIADLMKGVAPQADLSAAKVLDSSGSGDDSLGVLGIQWCANRASVDVISLSLGSDVPSDGLDGLSQAVDAAVLNKGKIVVAAAGNGGDLPGTITSPGSAAQALTVGATADWSAPVGYPYHAEGPFLAWFSSRGPTEDNRVKPDVVAPGVNVGSASAGSTNLYVAGAEGTGTSFATPFVSGVAALLRQQQPNWTQAQVRSDIEGTAVDVGAAGKDNDYGAGMIDGYAAVAQAESKTGTTTFPTYQHLTGSVPNGGPAWTTTFTLGAGDLNTPIAATVTVTSGNKICTLDLGPLGGCLIWEWDPDLEAELFGPNNFSMTKSTCAAGDECSTGRQETLHAMPTTAGTYTIKVTPAAGAPNNGKGGSFSVDLFHGPAPGGPPPPPTPNVHIGDLDDTSSLLSSGWRAQVKILAEDQNAAIASGAVVTGTWPNGTKSSCTTNTSGICRISKKMASGKLSIVFTVTNVSSAVGAYKASANHDPDTDSNGTKITLRKP